MLFCTTKKQEKWRAIDSLDDIPDGVKFVTALEKDSADGNHYRGDLYFDIDNENLSESLVDTRELVERIYADFDIEPNVWFSGKKGFHVTIPMGYFENPETFVKDLPKTYKFMAYRIGKDIKSLDRSIYSSGKGRMFRVEGCYRDSTRLYKTRLTLEQLFSLDLKDILNYCSVPHEIIKDGGQDTKRSEKLTILYHVALLFSNVKKEKKGSVEEISSKIHTLPPCLNKIIASPDAVRVGATFNDVVMLLSTFFAGEPGKASEACENLIKSWDSATYKTINARRRFLEYMCEYTEEAGYEFSCNFARKLVGSDMCSTCEHSVQKVISETIVVENNSYYTINKKGDAAQISNFIIVPINQISDNGNSSLGGEFRFSNGYTKKFTGLSNTQMKDRRKFLAFLPLEAWFIGSEANLQIIGSNLMGYPMNLIKMVPCFGLHWWKDRWYYIDDGGALNASMERSYSIVSDPKKVELKVDLVSAGFSTEENMQLVKDNILFNSDSTVAPILGWVSACFLHPILKRYDPSRFKNFPLLQVFGLSGSGKSETLIAVRKLFGFQSQVGNYNSYTPFAKEKLLASSNMHPIFFDEFKRGLGSKSIVPQFKELTRQVYGSIEGQKGQKDQTLRYYQRYNPVAIFGEETVSEKATMERVLFVSMDKFKSSKHLGEFKAFSSANLSSIGFSFLHYIMNLSNEDILAALDQAYEMVEPYQKFVLDRQFDNLFTMAIGIVTFGVFLDIYETLAKGFKSYARIFVENFTTTDKSDATAVFEFIERMLLDSSYQEFVPLEITKNKVVTQFLVYEDNKLYIDFKLAESKIFEYKGQKRLPTAIPDIHSIDRLMKNTDAYLNSIRRSIKNTKLWMRVFDAKELEKQGMDFSVYKDLIESEAKRKKK